MGRDRTEKKGKRRRPPPKLEPIGPLWDTLDAERKEVIVVALIDNLVPVVVKDYKKEMRARRERGEGEVRPDCSEAN